MELIMARGSIKRCCFYYIIITISVMLFQTAFAAMITGSSIFKENWTFFIKGQELPKVVIAGTDKTIPALEQWQEQHARADVACFLEFQCQGVIDENSITVLVRSRDSNHSLSFWKELQGIEGVSSYYAMRFSKGKPIDLLIGQHMVHLQPLPAHLMYLSAYQAEQFPVMDRGYCEILVQETYFKQWFPQAKSRTWFITGPDEDMSDLKKQSKLWKDAVIFEFSSMERYQNAYEMDTCIQKLSNVFFWLFFLMEYPIISSFMLYIRVLSESEDQKYRMLGIEECRIQFTYIFMYGVFATIGIIFGWVLGIFYGYLLAQEGLMRMGISIMQIHFFNIKKYLLAVIPIVLACIQAVSVDGKRFAGINSIAAYVGSIVLMVTALHYQVSFQSMVTNLYDMRYHYENMVLFDRLKETKEIQNMMSNAGIEHYELTASQQVQLRYREKEITSWITAVEDQSKYISILDNQNQKLQLLPNQIVISSRTARKLQVNIGDIIEFRTCVRGHNMTGSCLVSAISEQYCQFSDYIRIEDVTNYLHSSRVAQGCYFTEKVDISILSDVLFYGKKSAQRDAMRDSFSMISMLSYLLSGISAAAGFAACVCFGKNVYDQHKKSCHYLYMLGCTRWEQLLFWVKQGFYLPYVLLLPAIFIGWKTSVFLLYQMSSNRYWYPILTKGWHIYLPLFVYTFIPIVCLYDTLMKE